MEFRRGRRDLDIGIGLILDRAMRRWQTQRVNARRADSALRPGNVHSAEGWDAMLKPVVVRYQGKVSRIYFQADAAFAMPEVYEFLETERIKYAIRCLPTKSYRARSATS